MKDTHPAKRQPTVLMDTNPLMPAPVTINIDHVDSSSTLNDHINADSQLMTAQLALLMQAWPQVRTVGEIMALSDQVMKVADKRRELCLRPKSKLELGENDDIDITPVED